MPIDTLLVYCGVYGEAADALEDYELIKDLHTEGQPDRCLRRGRHRTRPQGQGQDHEEARDADARRGVLGGGVGLATGLVIVLFPAAAIGGGLLLGDHRRRCAARVRSPVTQQQA